MSDKILRPYQLEEVKKALHPARVLPWPPRTGKTRALVDSMRIAMYKLGLRRILVIAPKLASREVWQEEIQDAFTLADMPRVLCLVDGPTPKRAEAIEDEINADYPNAERWPCVIFVNPEALHTLLPVIKKWSPDGVIADELHKFKRAGAQRSRALRSLGSTPWRRGASGTLTPRNYLDVYSQWLFVNPERFGTRLDKFRERYVISDTRYPNRVLGYINLDELHNKVALDGTPVSRDAVGIPHEQTIIERITLSPAEMARYRKLAKQHEVELEDVTLSIPHRLSRVTALQQLASGYTPDGKWIHKEKIDATCDLCQQFYESGEPIVVFYNFTVEGDELVRNLRLFTERPDEVAYVNGRTSLDARVSILKRFGVSAGSGQLRDGPSIIVWQQSTDTQGISLAAANSCIFYSYNWNYDTVKQARDRIWKPEGSLKYIFMCVRGTIDEDILKGLDVKEDSSERFLSAVTEAQCLVG